MVALNAAPEASAWRGGPGRTILLVFSLQVAVNQASRRIGDYTKGGNPLAENLTVLAIFVVIAGAGLGGEAGCSK